ncbi:hypothetical protein GCM10009838_48010 [Catenulispora subtropica]|uniref:Uncharacterized protein n=1 Tax=Catenulispora subtropica TaxID=450798 RepID=A0ABN2S743_9ACTN
MPEEHFTGGQDPGPQDGLPGGRFLRRGDGAHGRVDLAHDHVDDAVEHVLLVGDVVIEGHRLHAELVGETAHGHGVDALAVGEGGGGAQDPVPGQWCAGLGLLLGLGGHLSVIRPFRRDRTARAGPTVDVLTP